MNPKLHYSFDELTSKMAVSVDEKWIADHIRGIGEFVETTIWNNLPDEMLVEIYERVRNEAGKRGLIGKI